MRTSCTTTMKSSKLFVSIAAVAATAVVTTAVPVTYDFTEPRAGTGSFAFDVGTALGIYQATSFPAAGNSHGPWISVGFLVQAGVLPVLSFAGAGGSLRGLSIAGTVIGWQICL